MKFASEVQVEWIQPLTDALLIKEMVSMLLKNAVARWDGFLDYKDFLDQCFATKL